MVLFEIFGKSIGTGSTMPQPHFKNSIYNHGMKGSGELMQAVWTIGVLVGN